jgi:FlaA1/EpsC-like NDP-sugar epimerase
MQFGTDAGMSPSTTPSAVVVGTPATIKEVVRQLALLATPPVVLGCVVHRVDGRTPGLVPPAPIPERFLRDVPVLGSLADLEDVVRSARPSMVLVSLPAAMHELVASVRTRVRRLGVADRFLPTLADQIAGIGPRSQIDVDLAALIGRPPRALDEASIAGLVRGSTVLVTGAGGSIGSELCRIVARYQPERLVMVERSENALFEIDRQIARAFPQLRRHAALHDVVDREGTKELFAAMRPDIVFHAAAHKHVPLSEDHPGAAIDNNLFGTVAAADASVRCGARRFVLISSDKAVHPTSVMGMTKRLAELYVQHVHRMGRAAGGATGHGFRIGGAGGRATGCSLVRFGNVLGSSGSVLETWKRQIADGGPITVTDPRMTRYFMSIPEAASLVLQAAALHDPAAVDGEVFVLDMGEPLRIVDLAKRFVEAHGLEPVFADKETDRSTHAVRTGTMPIVYTGVRPGEKLFEELALDRESMRPTRHADIRIWSLPQPEPSAIAALLEELAPSRRPREAQDLVALIRRHVPESRTSAFEEERLTRVA